MPRLSAVQHHALQLLEIEEASRDRFLTGCLVPLEFATESSPAIGLASKQGDRIRAGLLLLNDPGGGLKTLARFRSSARKVAQAFVTSELELFGAAVTNPKLRQMLLRQS
ncbi:MAG TPA: hypothetical protein VHY20_04820, partial [Pirellulales bacterium]|nr:hypothetical protein [Pirellulales bacterium]